MFDIVRDVCELSTHEQYAVRVRQSLGLRLVEHEGRYSVLDDWYRSWRDYRDMPYTDEHAKKQYLWTCCTILQNHLQPNVRTRIDLDVFDTIEDVENRQNQKVLMPLERTLYKFYRQFSRYDRRITASPAHQHTPMEALLLQL